MQCFPGGTLDFVVLQSDNLYSLSSSTLEELLVADGPKPDNHATVSCLYLYHFVFCIVKLKPTCCFLR